MSIEIHAPDCLTRRPLSPAELAQGAIQLYRESVEKYDRDPEQAEAEAVLGAIEAHAPCTCDGPESTLEMGEC